MKGPDGRGLAQTKGSKTMPTPLNPIDLQCFTLAELHALRRHLETFLASSPSCLDREVALANLAKVNRLIATRQVYRATPRPPGFC